MNSLSLGQRFIYLCFWPLSTLWDFIYKCRRFLYEVDILHSEKLGIPVISVGNVTLGGTGKTPITIFLANLLHHRGKRCMVLTRGYKSRYEMGSVVLKGDYPLRYDATLYGDEPVLISEQLVSGSVVVGKRRLENFSRFFFEERPDVVILDDGYQHLRIKSSLNLVLFDAQAPLSHYFFPPVGKLREGLNSLKDADIILLNRVDLVEKSKLEELECRLKPFVMGNTPIVYSVYRAKGWRVDDEELPLEYFKGKNVVCVAGIASPESFEKLIEKAGAKVVKKFFFSDHFTYQKHHVESFAKEARLHDASIVCTEKDLVKLRALSDNVKFYGMMTGIELTKGEDLFGQKIDELF
jgi:tetraacyldisaccharide 4'-kinase